MTKYEQMTLDAGHIACVSVITDLYLSKKQLTEQLTASQKNYLANDEAPSDEDDAVCLKIKMK